MRPVRQEIMWQAVLDAVAVVHDTSGDAPPLDILDMGGGTGGDAVQLAALGHRVTVVDPSPDALASLDRRAAEADLGAGSVKGLLADSSDVGEQVAEASADLVLLHGVVEHVDDPAEAMAAMTRTVRPGGVVSVVVASRAAAVLARALSGDFDGAAATFEASAAAWDVRSQGPRRYTRDELEALVEAAGLRPERQLALRVFADLVPSAVVDVQPGARERLYALERQVSRASEFSAISGGLQCIARLDLS